MLKISDKFIIMDHSQALREAIQERIALGYTTEDIKKELHEAGYDDAAVATLLDTLQSDTTGEFSSGQSQSVIGYTALLGDAFTFLKENIGTFLRGGRDIVILFTVAVAAVFMTLVTSGVDVTALSTMSDGELVDQFMVIEVIAALVLIGIVWVVGLNVVAFSVTRKLLFRRHSAETYGSQVNWSLRHIWPIIWLVILVNLATQLGYALLVLPGIALTFYLLFANYFLALGTASGARAMVESVELVYNRWWGVLARMFVVGIVATLVVGIIGAVFGLVGFGLGTVDPVLGFVVLGAGFIALVLGLLAYQMSAAILLFESLQETKRVQFTASNRSQLRIALLVAAGLGLVVAILQPNAPAEPGVLDSLRSAQTEAAAAAIRVDLLSLATHAEVYRADTDGSYEGVCAELRPKMQSEGTMDCIDRSDRWAFTLESPAGDSYCIDSKQTAVASGGLNAAEALCSESPQTTETESSSDAKNAAQELRTQD